MHSAGPVQNGINRVDYNYIANDHNNDNDNYHHMDEEGKEHNMNNDDLDNSDNDTNIINNHDQQRVHPEIHWLQRALDRVLRDMINHKDSYVSVNLILFPPPVHFPKFQK